LSQEPSQTRQRRVHRNPRTIPVRHRHRTKYDAPNGPGSVRHRTSLGTDWGRASSRALKYRPRRRPAISPKHKRRALSVHGVIIFVCLEGGLGSNFSSWQGQQHVSRPNQLKNGRGFTRICAFYRTTGTVRHRTGTVRPCGVCTNPVTCALSHAISYPVHRWSKRHRA
jgi:hypothetical protein